MANVFDRLDFVLGKMELFDVHKCLNILYLPQSVITHIQNFQSGEFFESLDFSYFVSRKENLLQVDESIQGAWSNFFNNIECHIKNNKVAQMINVFKLYNLVIIKF